LANEEPGADPVPSLAEFKLDLKYASTLPDIVSSGASFSSSSCAVAMKLVAKNAAKISFVINFIIIFI
jgi:hypothetical protein